MPQLMQSLLDWFRLAGYPVMRIALRSQICARNPDVRSFTTAGSERKDVVENPVKANGNLVDRSRGENVGFRRAALRP